MGLNFRYRISALLLILAFATGFAVAQRFDGTIRGQVLDATAAVVMSAKVTVTNQATGVVSSAVTSTAGTFDVPNLLPGLYTVAVQAKGFSKYELRNVQVQAGLLAEVNAVLKVGAETETLEVNAEAEQVNTVSGTISTSFQNITNLPLSAVGGGSVMNAAVLLPNVTSVSGTTSSSISVGGNRTRFINYTIDGGDNNSSSTTAAQQDVIQDAVQELVVSSNVFSAEYGHSAGANFNIVTKTGTNNWHGGGWWYNENRNYNAMTNIEKDTVDPTTGEKYTHPPRFDQQRLGGMMGGPVFKNKLFIFGSYEWFNQGTTSSSSGATAPTQAGITQLQTLAANDAVRGFLTKFPVASGQSGTLPVTVAGSTYDIPVGSVVANAGAYAVSHDYIINGDANLGNHSLHTRYIDHRERQPLYGAFPDPIFASNYSYRAQTGIFNYVNTINPHWVNDFRISYQRAIANYPVPNGFESYPNVTLDDLGISIGPNANYPQNSKNNNLQFQDSMSYAVGKWNLKWGVEARRLSGFNVFAQRLRGDYEYFDMTEFITDHAPTTFRGRNIGNPAGIGRFDSNQSALYGYFQSDWRVTTRLTLNLGLRYEWTGTPAGVQQNVLNSIASLPGTPLVWRLPKTDKNNLSPRFGFAWDPTGKQKWSIRGGAMLAYDVYPGNFYLNQQPAQSSFYTQEAGNPSLSSGQCNGSAFTPPVWCTAPYLNFLSSGGIPNVVPNITSQSVARGLSASLMADQVMPKVFQGSLGVQRELWKNGVIEGRYQFTRGVELPIQAQLNTVTAFYNGATPLPVYLAQSEIPATVAASAPTLAQFTGAVRPFKPQGFGNAITSYLPAGANRYHALSADYTQRSRWGVTMRANYTWSRNFDNSTADLNTSGISQRRPQDIMNVKADWGRSALDVTHKFAVAYSYELPNKQTDNAILRGFIHGWALSGTVLAQTGQPGTALAGSDINQNGDSAGDRAYFNPNGTTAVGTTTARSMDFVCRNGTTGATSVAGTSSACGGSAFVVGYVAHDPTQIYLTPRTGVLSNLARDTVDTPGIHVWNMSLAKKTNWGEKRYIEFRLDTFNTFNHRNYSFTRTRYTSNSISSSVLTMTNNADFLRFDTLDGGSRTMQLALRVFF